MAPQGLYGMVQVTSDTDILIENPLFVQDDIKSPEVFAMVRKFG